MTTTITTKPDLLHDVSNLAYVIADVSEGRETPHTLHQTYDICEEGNLSRVESLLTLAVAEVSAALGETGEVAEAPPHPPLRGGGDTRKSESPPRGGIKGGFVLRTKGLTRSEALKIGALIREYLTAAVLYGWLSVTLPVAAGFWKTRKAEIIASVEETVFSATIPMRAFPRRLPPI